MRKYTVIAALTLNAGAVVGLTKAQAATRSHALETIQVDKKTGMGEYRVVSPVMFKVGEEFYTDSDLNKQLATFLEPEHVTKAKARDKEREAADQKAMDEIKAKAKAWDDAQPELEALRAKAALYDALPEDVRKPAAPKA